MDRRLEMIKNAVHKIQGNPELRAAQAKINARFIKDCNAKIAKIRRRQERQLERELEAMDENYNHVEPKAARAFAESLVGEIYRETTKFDNEWN
jgi:hypothetical protein